MSTLSQGSKQKTTTLFHSNPVLSRLSKVTERSETDAASYMGIAIKTCYFLVITLVGMIVQLIVSGIFAKEPVWQSFEIYKNFTVTLTQKETFALVGVLIVGFVCEMISLPLYFSRLQIFRQ